MYSVDKCPDVGDASCLSLSTYICQRDFATIGGWVAEAAERSGAPDGELAIDLTFMERRGPRCTAPTCAPTPHYSTPKARYDADDDRDVVDWGRGRCASDGDCDGGAYRCIVTHRLGLPSATSRQGEQRAIMVATEIGNHHVSKRSHERT